MSYWIWVLFLYYSECSAVNLKINLILIYVYYNLVHKVLFECFWYLVITSFFFCFGELLLSEVFFWARILSLLFIHSWFLLKFLLFFSDINNNCILIVRVKYYNYLIFLEFCFLSSTKLKFPINNIAKLLFSFRDSSIELYINFCLGRLFSIKLFLLDIIKATIIITLCSVLYFTRWIFIS